jgi:hypothetical protein
MGKVTWEGWQRSADNAAEPKIGIVLRWATPERQNAFARMGDDLVIMIRPFIRPDVGPSTRRAS